MESDYIALETIVVRGFGQCCEQKTREIKSASETIIDKSPESRATIAN
jgi:hypothetical protein